MNPDISRIGATLKPWIAAALLALPVLRVDAIGTFNPTEAELALLPPYCVPRAYHWGNDATHPEVRRWRSVFGDDYSHMHHYCQGLLFLLRGNLEPLQSNRAYINYKKAVGNLEYMESRASPDFVLMPELYLKKGRALARMDQPREAVAAFRQSIRLKPDYVLAYAALYDFYLSRGQNEKARQVLHEGLAVVPDATILQRRLTEIRETPRAGGQGEEGGGVASGAPETPERTE